MKPKQSWFNVESKEPEDYRRSSKTFEVHSTYFEESRTSHNDFRRSPKTSEDTPLEEFCLFLFPKRLPNLLSFPRQLKYFERKVRD